MGEKFQDFFGVAIWTRSRTHSLESNGLVGVSWGDWVEGRVQVLIPGQDPMDTINFVLIRIYVPLPEESGVVFIGTSRTFSFLII